MNAATELAYLLIEHQLDLNRLSAGYQIGVAALFKELASDIEAKIGARPLTAFSQERISRLIADIKAEIADVFDEQRDLMRSELVDLAKAESQWALAAVNQTIGVDIARVLAPTPVLRQLVKEDLFQGAPLADWFKAQSDDVQFAVTSAIRVGVAQGETNAQIVNRLATQARQGNGGVLNIKQRNLETLVRTAVQTVANRSHVETWAENDEIIKSLQQLSTLDGRTSDICIAYSGKQWTLKDRRPIGHSLPWNSGTPRHWNCRSVVIPITKSFAELVIDLPEISATTRASMDGQVAADFTFEQFLEKKGKAFQDKTLGVGRAELWREGKITLTQLLDQRGNPLTLAELRRRYD